MSAQSEKAPTVGAPTRIENGRQVFTIDSPNELTRVVGWLKYKYSAGQVLYRGQAKIYPTVSASGFRELGDRGKAQVAEHLVRYIDTLAGAPCICPRGPFHFGQAQLCTEVVYRRKPQTLGVVQGTYRAAIEPLVQHYGVKTRWLDVVDNIWIALWFACHKQIAEKSLPFAHHMRRSEAAEGSSAKAVVVVLATGSVEATDVPGYYLGEETRVIDLRYAVPSVYLRPHAQHGLLIAPATLPQGSSGALTSNVVAELEINLGDALRWLGNGVMTSPFVLFPPATIDVGYRRLLLASPPDPRLGAIVHYGPGL